MPPRKHKTPICHQITNYYTSDESTVLRELSNTKGQSQANSDLANSTITYMQAFGRITYII
jgi:hypothetical protein